MLTGARACIPTPCWACCCLQEDENMDLASRNAQLEKRIAELEALAAAAEAAAQAHQQQREASPEPFTPQQQRVRGPGLGDDAADVQERATSVLKRAAAARRLSGMYEVRRGCPSCKSWGDMSRLQHKELERSPSRWQCGAHTGPLHIITRRNAWQAKAVLFACVGCLPTAGGATGQAA